MILIPNLVLRFNKVSKSYGRTSALTEVEFKVETGEFFGLAGVNGAGKTTLLKCLLDFCELDSGSIEIFGAAHTDNGSRARLCYLPERFIPPYYLTGKDFLDYFLKLHGLADDGAEVAAMLNALDLDAGALSRPVRAFSKGMTQKLGLAACFLSKKELNVLDEPMTGLDPKARALVKMLLSKFKAESRTLFFTSHSMADVAEICDRMAILHDGCLRFIGAPRALCESYSENNLDLAFLRCIS